MSSISTCSLHSCSTQLFVQSSHAPKHVTVKRRPFAIFLLVSGQFNSYFEFHMCHCFSLCVLFLSAYSLCALPANAPQAKPCRLFRCEEENLDGFLRFEARVLQGFDSSNATNDSKGAIIHASMGNGITMGPCHNGSCAAVGRFQWVRPQGGKGWCPSHVWCRCTQ